MEFTGIAGYILAWATMITAYTIFILGLFITWTWIADKLLSRFFKSIGMWVTITEFIWDKQKYKRKLKGLE